jgi:hypothetical protein
MSADPAAGAPEPRPTASEPDKGLSNADLTREVNALKRQNIDLYNQMQNILSRMAKLDRDVRAALIRRH